MEFCNIFQENGLFSLENRSDSKPQEGVENAACGDCHRRTRKCPTPHAGIAIAAGGVLSAVCRVCKYLIIRALLLARNSWSKSRWNYRFDKKSAPTFHNEGAAWALVLLTLNLNDPVC